MSETVIDQRLAKACPVCKAAPTGRCLEKVKDGHQYIAEPHPERYAEKKIKVAWIPHIEEYREVYECEHGLYYCLDPGDGLPTHIKDGDGIEVKEMTEAEADKL